MTTAVRTAESTPGMTQATADPAPGRYRCRTISALMRSRCSMTIGTGPGTVGLRRARSGQRRGVTHM
jgi:hypothetical protein